MNDLLTQSFEFTRRKQSSEANADIENRGSNDPSTGMEAFFRQVRQIEVQIDSVTTYLQKLQAANVESHSVTNALAMKAIKERMERDIEEVGRIALKVKKAIEEVDRDNLYNRQKPGCGKGTSIDRSRTAMTVALKKRLRERMSEFQNLRQNIHEEYRQVVVRRIFTVTGTRPDEETVEHLIETGNSEQIYEKAIHGQGRGQIIDTLAEIQERCDTVKDIEKKLYDLQQMFMDMSVLVEAQGDLLDDIETQVSKAVDHVNSAQVALQKGKKQQRNTRKYMCFALILFLVVLIIALGAALKTIKPWKYI